MSKAPALTKEENNLYRYFNLLKQEGDVPSVASCAPYGDLGDIAAEMCKYRAERGVDGIKTYLAALSKMKEQKYKRLVKILSSANPEEALNAPLYSGQILSGVTPCDVDWLWYPWLALGKMTTLDGDPGIGKSALGAAFGAIVSTGGIWPDDTRCKVTGGVVTIMPEDDIADTIQPRFARAGADLSKVVDLSTVLTDENDEATRHPFTIPDDLPYLEAAIKRVSAKLVFIDPAMAVVGGSSNTYKDNEVRALLLPLKMLIEKYKACCITVRHMTKVRGANPLMAGGGSIAFTALARTGLMVTRDPDNEKQAILSHFKSNIGELGGSLIYRVTSDREKEPRDDRPYIEWLGTTERSAIDLMGVPQKNTGNNRQEIKDLLQECAPVAMSVAEIAESLPEMTMTNLKVTLKRMYDQGEIGKSERGAYHAK